MSILNFLLLLAVSTILSAMVAAFRNLSVELLRHQAREGSQVAKKLYPLAARGSAVLLTLEIFRALFISAAFVLLARSLPPVLAWLLATALSFLALVILTEIYLRPFGLKSLTYLSGALLDITHFLKPVTLPLGRLYDSFQKHNPVQINRSSLESQLENIKSENTDLSASEIRIIKHALSFGDKIVRDIMTPRRVITSVEADEVLSPILLDELHKSGHSRFPVLKGEQKEVAGILYVHDLFDIKSHQKVKEVMHPKVNFVNEERELDHVLQAFLKTKQHMFMVVNSFAEVVGLITIEDVIEQILGRPIVDEFDTYDNMRAVAEEQAKNSPPIQDENMVQ